MLYIILKFIHIVAVVLFLGNIITGLFWKFHADGTRDPNIIAHTFKGIIRADRWFTNPSAIVITVMGVLAAVRAKLPILGTGWIFWSIVLFTISGIAFLAQVAPLQKKIRDLALAGNLTGEMNWVLYHSLSRSWEFWGLIALITPLGALALMVLKPALPGL